MSESSDSFCVSDPFDELCLKVLFTTISVTDAEYKKMSFSVLLDENKSAFAFVFDNSWLGNGSPLSKYLS